MLQNPLVCSYGMSASAPGVSPINYISDSIKHSSSLRCPNFCAKLHRDHAELFSSFKSQRVMRDGQFQSIDHITSDKHPRRTIHSISEKIERFNVVSLPIINSKRIEGRPNPSASPLNSSTNHGYHAIFTLHYLFHLQEH